MKTKSLLRIGVGYQGEKERRKGKQTHGGRGEEEVLGHPHLSTLIQPCLRLVYSWTFQLHESYFWKFSSKFVQFEMETIPHEILLALNYTAVSEYREAGGSTIHIREEFICPRVLPLLYLSVNSCSAFSHLLETWSQCRTVFTVVTSFYTIIGNRNV